MPTMPKATEVYGKQVKQMSPAERLRLAALILEGLTAEQNGTQAQTLSALQVLEQHAGGGIFKSAEEADEYLKAERETWDE